MRFFRFVMLFFMFLPRECAEVRGENRIPVKGWKRVRIAWQSAWGLSEAGIFPVP